MTCTKLPTTYQSKIYILRTYTKSTVSIVHCRGVTELNSKYTDLLPYLEQIDQIDASVERYVHVHFITYFILDLILRRGYLQQF